MAMIGVYKEIGYHRNFLWISFLTYLILNYYGYSYIGLTFFVLVFIKYYFHFSKWYYFICKDFEITYKNEY